MNEGGPLDESGQLSRKTVKQTRETVAQFDWEPGCALWGHKPAFPSSRGLDACQTAAAGADPIPPAIPRPNACLSSPLFKPSRCSLVAPSKTVMGHFGPSRV